ncbi:MAG TPA: hypothetical protein PLP14_08825, partial [Chitinophagaceae bacterium]|nr:hypothetical protein [Chitinophagaceae bacterium]
TITCAGNVSFNWSFNSPIDAYADFPQYSVNGGSPVPFPTYNMSLFGVTQTGSVTIPVSPGDVVTIEVVTIDNDALPGLLTITNFAAPAPMIGGTIKFWDAPVGGTDLGTPPLTVTPSGAGNISYYAEFTTTTTACPNLVRVPATVTVHALPTATLSGGGSVCSGSTLPDVLINLTGTSPWTFTYSDGTNSTTVTGAVTNPYVISGAAPGTYSLLSVNDANCTGSVSSGTVSVTVLPLPTATLSGGGTVCTGATLPDVSVALTGTSPWNLSYFDGSNTQNITGITTNPYIISGALGSYSVMNITDAACTGTFSGSATVANYPVPSVGASITPASVCYGSSAIPAGSGAVTYSWTGGLSDNTPFVASTSDTYTVTGTDNNGCTASASASITVSTQSNILSQSASGNSVSVTGSQNSTNNQADGTTVVYSDPSCDLIATVADLPGGNTLGTTVSTVTVEPTVLTYNSQPYTRRWFSITPTNNSGVNANVTIYQTQGDFDDYNAANGTYPDLPTGPLDATGISNVAVTKVSGGSLGIGMGVIIPNTVVWNATTNLWEISFTVTGTFSEFYVHAVNPLGGALPVELISFYGVQESASDRLEWQTAAESHNAGFEVEHSADGVHFTTVCQLGSLALNGNSSTKLEYQCVYDQPVQGHNYYRLIQIDMDGHRSVYQK